MRSSLVFAPSVTQLFQYFVTRLSLVVMTGLSVFSASQPRSYGQFFEFSFSFDQNFSL